MDYRHIPDDERLSYAISEVLHYVWDPIGIKGMPQTRDEYDSYVEQISALLRAGASEAEIAAHLTQVAEEHIGLPGRTTEAARAAYSLFAWHDYLY